MESRNRRFLYKRKVRKAMKRRKKNEWSMMEKVQISLQFVHFIKDCVKLTGLLTRLYKDYKHSVLEVEYIYLELRNFVSHPSHTKAAVTTNLETVSTLLPQPNNGFNTLDEKVT